MPRIKFDWEFNVGHVLTVIAFLSGAGAAVWAARLDIEHLRADIGLVRVASMASAERVGKIENTLDRLARVLEIDARQDAILTALEKRLDKLETRRD